MIYNLQHGQKLEITTLVLDLNGTLAVNGKIPAGVKPRIAKLKKMGFNIILFTGNQRGNADQLCNSLGIDFLVAKTSQEKESHMKKINYKHAAAIGNARIDIGTFKHAAVSVLTLQSEGIHTGCLEYCDIIVPSINDALDLFINHDTLCATLKK